MLESRYTPWDFRDGRSLEGSRRALETLRPYHDRMWLTQHILNTPPIIIPEYLSRNQREIGAGMRYVGANVERSSEGQQHRYRSEYIIGLFEMLPEDHKPIGYMVLNETFKRELHCHSSYLFETNMQPDTYFSSLAQKSTADAISVELDGAQNKRRGLGRLLLDLGMLTAQKKGLKTFDILGCNEESAGLVMRSGYPYTKEFDENGAIWDFTVMVPESSPVW